MFYSIRHSTKFRYSDPVHENATEIIMQPRSEGRQLLRQFDLTIEPRAKLFARRDYLGNVVHFFDVPSAHDALSIVAECLVEVEPAPTLPEKLSPCDWKTLDDIVESGDFWDWTLPSKFAYSTEAVRTFARDNKLERHDDPLTWVRELNKLIYATFSYVPQFTKADSPIDVALDARAGVCQDFSHIMIALLRDVSIPARYVSGYLFHRQDTQDRSVVDATHAWVEVYLPGLGWCGFDPTNNLECGERHIRTAIGRDYADVPPTRGTFKHKGGTTGEMKVAVHVLPATAPKPEELNPIGAENWTPMPDFQLSLVGEMEEMSQQ